MLVAVSIPIFTAQLHKSKRAVDEANARSLYANLQADYLTEGDSSYAAASWDASLKDDATFTGAGTKIKIEDGEEVELKDSDTTITLHLDAEKGWGMEFQCDEYDSAAIKWGVQ